MNIIKNFIFIIIGFALGFLFVAFGNTTRASFYSIRHTCERELTEFNLAERPVDEVFCLNLLHEIETDPVL